MSAMKRQAKSPMKSSKKAKDMVGPKIKELVDVLSNTECEVPGTSGNRDMLVGALPHALGDFSDVRHSYQNAVAKIIGDVMHGWVAKWEQKVADAKAHVDAMESDRASAIASQQSATSSLEAQGQDVKTCKDALTAASDAEKEAAGILAGKNAEVEKFDKGLQKIIAEKDNVSMVYHQSFLIMKSAEGVSASDGKTHLKKIMSTLKHISSGTESSLLIAITPALQHAPAERGQFDSMAIDGVESLFKSKIEKLSEHISGEEATKATKEAAAAEASTAHEATETKRLECIAALKLNQDAQEEKEKALAAADKNLDATSKAANKALKASAHEQRGLDHAKGNLASFQFLLERTTPPPPPPEEPEKPQDEAPPEA